MNRAFPFRTLESLEFDNRFVRELPGDMQLTNYRRQVLDACYSKVTPATVTAPQLVSVSRHVAELLNISEETCKSSLFRDIFVGNTLLPGMDPFSMCYGGHQFGSWADQLGDGRAINLGEVINARGERWILQLKGAGPTPYSRNADGLAVLRSSVREFLCSEAMYHLGVPTTRALSLISTGELVLRDMFYDGHPKDEPGAVVCRVSPSFIRFGNFELLAARKDLTLLRQLIDYTISTDFPHLGAPSKETYLRWFDEVCKATVTMILHWMRVGFVHGVMNTDNMSILGLTIDYGPYGWLDGYDPDWTPNTTDAHGRRYCFKNQPHIGQWNLLQLANAIYPLINEVAPFENSLANYNTMFLNGWNDMMAAKLGLDNFIGKTDDSLIGELIDILQLVETDMTIFFRNLSQLCPDYRNEPQNKIPKSLLPAYYEPENIRSDQHMQISSWLKKYTKRLALNQSPHDLRKKKMNSVNPKYILRNYLAQTAIEKAETGDYSEVNNLLTILQKPYSDQPSHEKYFAKQPEWARNKPGCSMLSCSS